MNDRDRLRHLEQTTRTLVHQVAGMPVRLGDARGGKVVPPQLAVITEIIVLGSPPAYTGSGLGFLITPSASVFALLLDLPDRDDTFGAINVDNPDELTVEEIRISCWDVRKDGSPRVGEVVRVWADDGTRVRPGDEGTGLAPNRPIFCDVFNVTDYLRGLTGYEVTPDSPLVLTTDDDDIYWDVGGATGPEGPEGPQGPAGPTGPAGADGADGESPTEGYAIDVEAPAVVHFDPTEITGFVGADASQLYVHFAGAVDRDDPAWKTALDYDPLAVCQLLVNFADDWEWATLDDYSIAAQQLLWQDQGNWRFMTTTGYDDTDATQLLGHVNGAWQWKPDRRPTAIDLDTNANSLRIRLTLSDGTILSDSLPVATILNALAGYNAGNDQSIGHDASGSTLWQDDEDECPA